MVKKIFFKKTTRFIVLYSIVFIFFISLYFIHTIYNSPFKKIDNFETKLVNNANIYTNQQVVVADFKIKNITFLTKIIDELKNIREFMGYKIQYVKLDKKYRIIFDCDNEEIGIDSLYIAFYKITNSFKNIKQKMEDLKRKYQKNKLGPTTISIVNCALKHNIPYFRLNEDSLVQLGWGKHQKRIEASTTTNTRVIGETIAKNKDLTKEMLKSMGIPVAEGYLIEENQHAYDLLIKYFEILGSPVVIKPYDGNHGNGVTTNINNVNKLKSAYKNANKISEYVIIEKHVKGNDYRILLINNKFVAASKRTPACVVGNGKNSIHQLISQTNQDPKRGNEHESELTKITYDDSVYEYLWEQGFFWFSVPRKNQIVYLRKNGNLSTGGTAEDVTDIVHPSIIEHAINASIQIDIDVCGIDVVCEDISKPLEIQDGCFIEVNSGPGLRMHLYPSSGKSRDVCEPIISGLFPNNSDGRIPIVSITGVNGKTTTVNILSFILKASYDVVGKTTTNGVYINDFEIEMGDCSGPLSAQKILVNPTVDIAVLETARGGILRGLAFDNCDVGVITNIGKGDHIGTNYESSTIDELIELKCVVLKYIKPNGYAVLNASDENIYKILAYLKNDTTPIFFSRDKHNKIINEQIQKGRPVVYYNDNSIIYKNNNKDEIFHIKNIPILENLTLFQIENILCVISCAISLKIDVRSIKKELQKYENTIYENPGRFNIVDYGKSQIIVDYGHNLDAINYISEYSKNNSHFRKKIIMYGAAGDRDIEVIKQIIETLYNSFDILILFETNQTLRGKKQGELLELMKMSIPDDKKEVYYFDDELVSIDKGFNIVDINNNDLFIALIDDVSNSIEFILEKLENK